MISPCKKQHFVYWSVLPCGALGHHSWRAAGVLSSGSTRLRTSPAAVPFVCALPATRCSRRRRSYLCCSPWLEPCVAHPSSFQTVMVAQRLVYGQINRSEITGLVWFYFCWAYQMVWCLTLFCDTCSKIFSSERIWKFIFFPLWLIPLSELFGVGFYCALFSPPFLCKSRATSCCCAAFRAVFLRSVCSAAKWCHGSFLFLTVLHRERSHGHAEAEGWG